MENRPTERPDQTIPEIASVILGNPGVQQVEIIDASTGVCIVDAFVNKAHGHGLTISVPHDDEDYREWEYLQMAEWETALHGERTILHCRFDGHMSKDVLIPTIQSAIKQTRRNADKRDRHSLMPYPDQILRIRILCDEGQENCALNAWNEHIKGSVWFDVIEQPVPVKKPFKREGWYEGHIRVRSFGGSILFKKWFNERLDSPSLARLPGDVWHHTAGFLGLNQTKNHSRRRSDPPGWTRQIKRRKYT